MSHFSRIRTQFRNREALIHCLHELGWTVETDAVVQGHRGQQVVDIAVKTARGYGIGFVQNSDGMYDMVADWWGVKDAGQKNILAELGQQAQKIQVEYAKSMVLEQTAKQGFGVVSETKDSDGTVRIVVRRWA